MTCNCSGCPFAFTEESEIIQNYGCLPTPMETVRMRTEFGKTWSCHKDIKKPCAGTLSYLKEENLPYKVIDITLVNENSEFLLGFYKLVRTEEQIALLKEDNKRLKENLDQERKNWDLNNVHYL